jgi:hypothetical protein
VSTGDARVAHRISLATFAATLATFVIAVATPPLSGPFCRAVTCYAYPYTDTAARFPRDFLWMYPAMAFAAFVVAWIACIHHLAPARARLFTLMGLCAGGAGAATLIVDYFVQLAVVQRSLLADEADGVALISQYNAHGVFIALEEVGYLLIALSFPFVATAFGGVGRLECALRWTLAGGFLLAMGALAVVSFRYGIAREYRFEVAVITIDVLVVLAATIMTALVYRRAAVGVFRT